MRSKETTCCLDLHADKTSILSFGLVSSTILPRIALALSPPHTSPIRSVASAMARNAKSVVAVVVASLLVALVFIAVTNDHMQTATSDMFRTQSVTMLEDISSEVAGKKLKHPGDAALAAKMQQMINDINGDYSSMMSYGSKAGYVAPASESIAAQARDGSLYKSPDIPDPPKFMVNAEGIVVGAAGYHSAAVPAVALAPAPVHHADLSANPVSDGTTSVSAKEAKLEAELRKLKEQDLEAQLHQLQAPATLHSAVVSADAPIKSAVHSDASYLLSHQANVQVPHPVAPSDNAPDSLSHPIQHAAAVVGAQGSASGAYIRNGIK
jgi:hypothetical protein